MTEAIYEIPSHKWFFRFYQSEFMEEQEWNSCVNVSVILKKTMSLLRYKLEER